MEFLEFCTRAAKSGRGGWVGCVQMELENVTSQDPRVSFRFRWHITADIQGLKPVALLAENNPVVGKDSKIPMHEKHPSGAVLTFDS